MVNKLVDVGEEFFIKYIWKHSKVSSVDTVEVALFNSGEDEITDCLDLPLDSEPSDGNYERQVLSFDSEDVSISKVDGSWVMYFRNHTFDVRNTTGSVDHYAVIVEFESDDKGDSSPQKHICFVGELNELKDLTTDDQVTLEEAGFSLE